MDEANSAGHGPGILYEAAGCGKDPAFAEKAVAFDGGSCQHWQGTLSYRGRCKGAEQEIDEMEAVLPPLGIYRAGGYKGGAYADLARTMIRRAERRFLELARTEEVHEADQLFLNRSSDYCFMLLRLEENKE